MLDAWSPELERVAWIVGLAVAAHLGVLLVRLLVRRLMATNYPPRMQAKIRSVLALAGSVAVFAIYFSALGLVLSEFGVSMTAYFASTTIIGLAVGFGSQGMVQDVVTGLTVIATDLFDVGDMVEIAGQTGIVESIGMRFVALRTGFGTVVRIPNRTIANVVRYPRDYVRCALDVRTPDQPDAPARAREIVERAAAALQAKYPRLFRASTEISERRLPDGARFLRAALRMWPGRTGVVESELKPQVLQQMKQLYPDFADWMVSVNIEVEEPATESASDPLAALHGLRFWRRSA